MPIPSIYPVIHHLDRDTSLSQVTLAHECGADGVFLISHLGDDDELVNVAWEAQRCHSGFSVGVNLLSKPVTIAATMALEAGLRMLWADDMGVDSTGLTGTGIAMSDFAKRHPEITCLAGVAFKYRPHESRPVEAAHQARVAGFLPTTSGAATGQAPDLAKIKAMGSPLPLGVASGITPENVEAFAPYLSHILVSTGISYSEHHIDAAKLLMLIQNARP